MGKFIEQNGMPFEVVEVERKAALRSVRVGHFKYYCDDVLEFVVALSLRSIV